jgi:hypothetical protein
MGKHTPTGQFTGKQLRAYKNAKAASQAESIARRAEGKPDNRKSRGGWFSKGPSPKDR